MSDLTLSLSHHERDLILRYGYPFEHLANECRRLADDHAPQAITDDHYWWSQLAGNLAITLNEDDPPCADALQALLSRVEDLLL